MSFLTQFKHEKNRRCFECFEAQNGVPLGFWDVYSAFSNTEGGTVVLGAEVMPNGELAVFGVQDPQALVSDLWLGLNNSSRTSSNTLFPNNIRIEEEDGHSVVVVEIPKAPRRFLPVFVRGNARAGTFRYDEGPYRCSQDEYESLVRDSSNSSLDTELLSDFDLSVVSRDTLSAFREKLAQRLPHSRWSLFSDEELLFQLGVISKSAHDRICLSRAGLLMFGTDEAISEKYPNFAVEFRAIYSRRRWDWRLVSGDGTWPGNLYEFWTRSVGRLSHDLSGGYLGSFTEDVSRQQAVLSLLSEGLLNALIHADYAIPGGVMVIAKPESVSISNPGVSRVPPADFLLGGFSDVRNAGLASLFLLAGVSRPCGAGYQFMASTCDSLALTHPQFSTLYSENRSQLDISLLTSREGGSSQKTPAVEVPTVSQVSPPPLEWDIKGLHTDSLSQDISAPQEPSFGVGQADFVLSPRSAAPESVPAASTPPLPSDQGGEAPVLPNEVVRRVLESTHQDHPSPDPAPLPVQPETISSAFVAQAPAQPSYGYEAEILALISKKGMVRRKDVEALLGLGASRTKVILAGMVDAHQIQMVGSGRSTSYCLV